MIFILAPNFSSLKPLNMLHSTTIGRVKVAIYYIFKKALLLQKSFVTLIKCHSFKC